MVHNTAFSILSAAAGTGITALLLLTREIRWAIRVKYTLRATSLVGIAKEIGQALTGSGTIALYTLGIGAAWRWLTGIYNFHILFYWLALRKWIAR